MNDNTKSLLKNVGYLTISNFASKILVFLLVPLYTSVLSTEEYGTYDAIVVAAQFLAPLLIANISDGVMRYLLDGKDKDTVTFIGYKYLLLGAIIAFLLCVINFKFQLLSFLNGYEYFAFLYFVFYILNNHYTQYAKGLNKLSAMAIAGFLGTIITLVSNLYFLLVLKAGIEGFFAANILGLAIPCVYYLIIFKDWKYLKNYCKNTKLDKEILHYSFPLVFNTIGWTINSSLDKYCVIFMLGVSASGILAVSYKIPTIMSVIYAIFTQAWQVSAVTAYNKADREKFYSDTFLVVNALGAVVCTGLLLFNRFLANFLFSGDFYIAWKYVPFLLLSVMFNQTAGFIGPLLSAKKDSIAMAKAAIWGSLSNLLLNILFIKILGLQGAAIATAISSFIIYFVRWWYAKDLLENRIYVKLYFTWIVLGIGAVIEAIGLSCFIQIIVLLVILFINKNELEKIINILFRGIRK